MKKTYQQPCCYTIAVQNQLPLATSNKYSVRSYTSGGEEDLGGDE
jgi:hypothetical protein